MDDAQPARKLIKEITRANSAIDGFIVNQAATVTPAFVGKLLLSSSGGSVLWFPIFRSDLTLLRCRRFRADGSGAAASPAPEHS